MGSLTHTFKHATGQCSILLARGLLTRLGAFLKGQGAADVLCISNTTLQKIYQRRLRQALARQGLKTQWAWIPDGEVFKNLKTVSRLYDQALQGGMDRKTFVVAFGGGVVGDVAGFVAATLLRGLTLIQVPTTLVAMVDSAIGGKTGVDHALGKNLIGTFYQPRWVLIDPDLLATLPAREFRCGMAEVIKYGAIMDPFLFATLEKDVGKIRDLEHNKIDTIIRRCVLNKASVVATDEREGERRSMLNFGHTLGHAWERLAGFRSLHHGEAVAYGMAFSACLGGRLDITPAPTVRRLLAVLRAYDLDISWPRTRGRLLTESLRLDKKSSAGKIKFVLLQKIGQACFQLLDPAFLAASTLSLKVPAAES